MGVGGVDGYRCRGYSAWCDDGSNDVVESVSSTNRGLCYAITHVCVMVEAGE